MQYIHTHVFFGRAIDEEKAYSIIEKILWVVVLFGIFDVIIGNSLWRSLNIETLWRLKGISNLSNGIPRNWYSSEKIGGVQIRRMVSTFADPVNLGTFLFSGFMLAWYRKKWILGAFTLLACVLTVSKGALIGFLIFIVIFTWYKDRTKMFTVVTLANAVVAGYMFLTYSQRSSTGSVFLHISGFVSSLGMLVNKPFGYGIGRVGVLAQLFSVMK